MSLTENGNIKPYIVIEGEGEEKVEKKKKKKKEEGEGKLTCISEIVSHKMQHLKKPAILYISRAPIVCPLTKCNYSVGATSLLSHFLSHHESPGECRLVAELYRGDTISFSFKPDTIRYNEMVCFGMLLYGGIDRDPSSRPGIQEISLRNAFLMPTETEFEYHMPILLMGSRCCFFSEYKLKNEKRLMKKPENDYMQCLVLWLAGQVTTRPVWATLRVTSTNLEMQYGCMVRIRDLRKDIKPFEFLTETETYLRMSLGDTTVLLQDSDSSKLLLDVAIDGVKYKPPSEEP